MKKLQIGFDSNSSGHFSNAVSYNTFSIVKSLLSFDFILILFQVAKFLDLKDLMNLMLVNRRLYNFVDSERIWKDQFLLNWKKTYNDNDDKVSRNYKEKCQKAYLDSRDKRFFLQNQLRIKNSFLVNAMKRKKMSYWDIII